MTITEPRSGQTTPAELQTAVLEPPAETDGPIFNTPWDAQAFAMTLALHERGFFTWKEWAATLSEAIQDAQGSGNPDSGTTYYHHWLASLERICIAKNFVSDASMARRKDLWDEAARLTPHGKPIALAILMNATTAK